MLFFPILDLNVQIQYWEKHPKIKNMKFFISLLFSLCALVLHAQDSVKVRNWELKGYLGNMQSAMFQDVNQDWITDQLFHNRINFKWMPSENFIFAAESRNRFMYGQMLQLNPSYAITLDADNGWMDLSTNISEGKSYLLNASIDRLYADYQSGSLQITLGRQRINWGQTFVWNPNDLFNTYSFFDFDYPEKPGSDALRVQYYTGAASSVEAVAKINHSSESSYALLWKTNQWNTDFQVLAGIYEESDLTLGAGFSGAIGNLSLRGEGNYFTPKNHFADSGSTVVVSLGCNYTFSNSLTLQFESLYNQLPSGQALDSISNILSIPFSSKKLSFTDYNIFGALSYPLNPLLTGSLSAMYYPELDGYYLGADISYSIRQDMDLTAFYQFFHLKLKMETGNFNLAALRLKWSF